MSESTHSIKSYHYIKTHLPYNLSDEVLELPDEAQMEFLYEYQDKEKSVLISYILQFAVWAHYGYMGQWGLQILFWLTGGGLGLWWFILWFTIPGSVKNKNIEMGRKLLRKYKAMYGNRSSTTPLMSGVAKKIYSPRSMADTPANATDQHVSELMVGSLLDYKLITWQVDQHQQYDWSDGNSERCLRIVAELDKRQLYLQEEGGYWHTAVYEPVNIHRIDAGLESLLLQNEVPPASLNFNGATYYRELSRAGQHFLFKNSQYNVQTVKGWLYLDDQRKNLLRIDTFNDKKVSVLVGSKISDIEISDILPPQQ
jgi:hypothetical protein